MIKTKKIFLIIILTFFYFSESSSLIKDSIFATVGNKAITKSDILDEIKIILILSGRSYYEDKKEQLKQVAIQTAIKRKKGGVQFTVHCCFVAPRWMVWWWDYYFGTIKFFF